MSPLYSAYITLTNGLFLIFFPVLWAYTRFSGNYQEGLRERLGFVTPDSLDRLKSSPRLWMHAVSLGEVKVAASIKKSLDKVFPGHQLILSTFTESGYRQAKELFPQSLVIYAPLDLAFAVKKALDRIRPDILIFLETELWPVWLMTAHRRGIKIALLNGRISERSIASYLKFKFFFREVLKNIRLFSMICEEDARRIKQMGAPRERVTVGGNAKYDLLSSQTSSGLEQDMRRILNLPPKQIVLIAGSTRSGEESTILAVYVKIRQAFPDTVLFIAPRHIERTPEIEKLLNSQDIPYQLRTQLDGQRAKRTAPVVIMNTFGELFKLYSVGVIIFCGASLVPLGGQNPLEAAAWGKMVFYGPSMEDFLDAKELLESQGSGIEVTNAREFAEKALYFLHHPEEMAARGARIRRLIQQNQGAAQNHAAAIARL